LLYACPGPASAGMNKNRYERGKMRGILQKTIPLNEYPAISAKKSFPIGRFY
jgi:hypothetical protein